MKISREFAIIILKYCFKNPNFYFPFLVMCKEYSQEDDDFVEVCHEEWENIEDDEIYQTFELWENLQDLRENTTELLVKGFINNIINETIENEIKQLYKYYGKLYKEKLTESVKILEYGENEFFGGKKEAFEEVIELIKKYKI